jgi:MFS family permease
MPAATAPRLAKSYAANVVLVILTLFPGLINTSAVALAAPVIGADLGVAPDTAAALPLISDAALAFGCLLGAELTRRFDNRTLYFWLLGLTLITSLASALAPAYGVLLAAHVLHGLAGGVLFIVILPSLITNFGSEKLGATAGVIVPALFGAATLGPLVGGFVAAPGLWRAMFAAEVVLAVGALALATLTLQQREPQGADEPVDWTALIAAAIGSGFVYFGAGALVGHDWSYPPASVPVALGVGLYAVLLVAEARKEHPLVPVRKLFTSLALVGTIATVLGSVTFSALTQCFSLTLLRVDGLAPRATGFAFWPEFLTAVAAGFVFGRLVASKWVIVLGAVGLGFITLAALLARAVAPVDAGAVGWLCLIGGFGAGLSVSPGLFVIALSFEKKLVGRAIALLNLFRLTAGFVSAPGVEHTIGSRARDKVVALDPAVAHSADAAVRAFLTGRSHPAGAELDALRRALAAAISDAYVIVAVLGLIGIAAVAAVLVATHVELRAPDLKEFDDGKPALETPALA